MKARSTILITVFTCVAILVGAVVAMQDVIKARRVPPAPLYTVAKVERGDLVKTIRATGILSPAVSVEVSSQISGVVTLVAVDFNSRVKKGQILARVDPATFEQRLRQSQADLQTAEANHNLTLISARRLKELREQDLIPQQDYDQVEAQVQAAHASLSTRRAALENARVDLERCTITSPIDGVVIYKQIEVGRTVVSSFSAPVLFTIAEDLSIMRILAQVSEVDVGYVHPGQRVEFTVEALPERTFDGRVVQVRNPYTPIEKQSAAPQQQRAPATFETVIIVDNPDLALRPSQTADVTVIIDERSNAIRIPNGALRLRITAAGAIPTARASLSGGVATVYRLPNGDRRLSPQAVRVKVGISDEIATEILSGINVDDIVVTGIATPFKPPERRFFF